MRLDNYALHLPAYSVGNKVYQQIDSICRPYGTRAVVIGGSRAMEAAREKLETALVNSEIEITEYVRYGTDCTFEAVEKLRRNKAFLDADMVFAVGGGKAIDTCKNLCIEDQKPIFTFPTIASNCAACTSVSIMYHEDGTFYKPYFYLQPPLHAFIDTQILAEAPVRYMWAGIGDTCAKYYEAAISSRNEELQHFTALGVCLSRMCQEPLLQYAGAALEDNRAQRSSYELEQTALAIIVTTAIVSIFLTRDFTPDYNSGLAHAVFYALTRYPVIEEKHLHGEVVSFGVLIALLCDGQEEEFLKLYEFNRQLKLPVSVEELDLTKEQFADLYEQIPKMSDVHHYPYDITKEMLETAIERLEGMRA